MFMLYKYKIHSKLKFLFFFLSMAVLAGCKPSIDVLNFSVIKVGEPTGEGYSISIDGPEITLEAINPGEKLDLDVETGDGESSHVATHRFSWQVVEGDIGAWQINGNEAAELGQDYIDSYDKKTIQLTAPDGADSQITLQVTVICDEASGANNSTTLDIQIASKRSFDQMRLSIKKNFDDVQSSIIKAGDRKSHMFAEVIQGATNHYLLEKEPDLDEAEAKLHYVRTLEEKTQKNTYLQDMTSKIDSADGVESCVSSFSKDFAYHDHKFTQEEKHHNAICDHVIKLKESMNETCIEVADRGAGDRTVYSCNNDEDDSSRQNFSNKAGDSRGQFVPYLKQHTLYVTYKLTEDETYILTGNAKDLPRLLGYKSLAKVNCDPINAEQFCVKKIPQDQIAGLRLMLSQLYEIKHPMMCGGKCKTNQDFEKQISSITQLGKRDRPDNENTINQQDGNKKQKNNSGAENKIKAKQNSEDDIDPDDYCRTVSFNHLDYPYMPVYPKESEKAFVQKAKDEGKVVICFSAVFADPIDGMRMRPDGILEQAPIGFEFDGHNGDISYAIDCDIYDHENSLDIGDNICGIPYNGSLTYSTNQPITFFVALPPNDASDTDEADEVIFSFKNYYYTKENQYRLILKHIETGNLGNVEGVTIRDRSGMFRGSHKLQNVYINTTDTENMSYMFAGATEFNSQTIIGWDVSNVNNMSGMFQEAMEFNQPIGNWDVSNVNDMSGMFQETGQFNQNLNEWKVGKVKNMAGMFRNAHIFDSPIGVWDVRKVEDMSTMFLNASEFNQPIGNWSFSNIKDMHHMFQDAILFNQDLSNWDVNSDTNVEGMYEDCGIDDNNKHQQQ